MLRPRPRVTSLCSCKEKLPRESTPGAADCFLRFSQAIGACPNSPAVNNTARALTRGTRMPRWPTAMLGGGYGDLKKATCLFRVAASECWFFKTPYGAPEPRKALGARPEWGADRDVCACPAATGIVASGQRGTQSRGGEGVFAPSGACFFWFLFFARAKKRNLPWVSHPQVAFERSRAKRAIPYQTERRPKPPFFNSRKEKSRSGRFPDQLLILPL